MTAPARSGIGSIVAMGADSDTVSFKPDALDPLIGALLLDRYRITRSLGGGRMGLGYGATHVAIGRRVAIKFLREQHMNNAEMMARFERESRLGGAGGRRAPPRGRLSRRARGGGG